MIVEISVPAHFNKKHTRPGKLQRHNAVLARPEYYLPVERLVGYRNSHFCVCKKYIRQKFLRTIAEHTLSDYSTEQNHFILT